MVPVFENTSLCLHFIMRFHRSIKHKSYTTHILIGQTWQPRSTCVKKMKLFVAVLWEMQEDHRTWCPRFFLVFQMYQRTQGCVKKYVRALTYQTLGDIIENLIPEGECVASLVSVKDQSELDVGMTQACMDAFDVKRVVLRGDSLTPTQASKPSVFDILMEESTRLTSLPAWRFVYTKTFSQQIAHVLLIFE